MRKKLSSFTIVFTIVLFLLVPFKPAEASIYIQCKNLFSVNYKTSGFLGAYNTALLESLAHWSTIPQVNVKFNGSSSNYTMTAAAYSEPWLGANGLSCSGSNVTKSIIQINTRTIANETNVLTLKNFARSTITHEIAHTFGLADNPIPSNPDWSLMNYLRDRTKIYDLTSYDRTNLANNY